MNRMRVQVPAEALPVPVRALLDPDRPRPADSRYQPAGVAARWLPAAALAAAVTLGLAGLSAARAGGDAGLIYGALSVACLPVGWLSLAALQRAVRQRRERDSGRYRQGLHLLGAAGLLVAGRTLHTWIPRGLLPEAVDVTPPGGGPDVPRYAFTVSDEAGRADRVECGPATRMALWLWAQRGVLPDDDGWLAGSG